MAGLSGAVPRRRSTPPLSRERVISEALALLDEEGLEGLSMRRLAARLRVEAMSLYHHVRDKHDLLDGVVDHALSGLRAPDPSLPWDLRLEGAARGLYAALVAHPPLVLVLASEQGRPTSAPVLAVMASTLQALGESGLAPADQVSAFRGLVALVFGFALTHTRGSRSTPAEAEAVWSAWEPAAHPELGELGAQFRRTRPPDDLSFALEGLLAVLRARATAG